MDEDQATAKHWSISVDLAETSDETAATVRLVLDARTFSGLGSARRNPVDSSIPRIGEELAVARALSDLSHRLMEEATRLIEDHGPQVPAP
jgi:hypothetical protein